MTHEAGIEAAVAAGDDFPGMSCFVNSKQRNEAWVTAIIQSYLSASGMVLVPRKITREMDSAGYDHCPWDILKKDHQDVYYAMVAAAPDPFNT